MLQLEGIYIIYKRPCPWLFVHREVECCAVDEEVDDGSRESGDDAPMWH